MPTIDRADPLTWPIGWRPPLTPMTRKQREALKRIQERGGYLDGKPKESYRALRLRVLPTIACDDAVALPIWGMWLCIEKDGYTHS